MEGEKWEEEGSAVCVLTANTMWERQGEITTQFIHVKSFWEQIMILGLSVQSYSDSWCLLLPLDID